MANPNPLKPKKSENAEIALRIEEVLRLRIDGAQFHDIVQYGAETPEAGATGSRRPWNVNGRQIRNYIRRADELLVERQDKSRKQLIARRFAQREALYARAINAADLRTALAVLDSADKLRGLFASDRDTKELIKLVVEQERRIKELEAAAHDQQPKPTRANEEERTPAGGTGGGDRG